MPLQSISALQLFVFGAAWLLAAVLVRERRSPALHWATYNLLQAAQLAVVLLPRTPGRVLLAVVIMGGFAAAFRGMEAIAGQPHRHDRWLGGAAAAVVLGTAVALGLPAAEARTLQISVLYAGISLLLLGTAPWLWRLLRPAFGPVLASVAILPNLSIGIAQLAMVDVALQWPGWSDPAQRESIAKAMLGLSVSMTAVFNLVCLYCFVASLVRQLRHGALHDHLTALPNRRQAEAALAHAWARHQRDGAGLALLIVDLDHFKRVNDEHGHEGGDRALVFAADVLRAGTRGYDTPARWGGEEFVVVLPGTGADAAHDSAQRLREAIESGSTGRLGHALSASIGVTAAAPGDAGPDDLVRRADAALYRAKAAGRNRVETG